jgi:hypothetical protein
MARGADGAGVRSGVTVPLAPLRPARWDVLRGGLLAGRRGGVLVLRCLPRVLGHEAMLSAGPGPHLTPFVRQERPVSGPVLTDDG